jgi:hypothetical protein
MSFGGISGPIHPEATRRSGSEPCRNDLNNSRSRSHEFIACAPPIDREIDGRSWAHERFSFRHWCIPPSFVTPLRRAPFLSPPCEGGRRGGGQRATSHGEIKGTGGWSRRHQLRDVQIRWGGACSFAGQILARLVPDCSLTTPPGPPFTSGGKCSSRGQFVGNCRAQLKHAALI